VGVPDPSEGVVGAAQTPYALLGGDAAVRALVERFYDLMDLEPAYAELRALHAKDLAHAREKLYLFLSGWLGGPSLYVERYGHPMLRRRHLPFPIGIRERDQWMACMRQAMAEQGVAEALQARLGEAFLQTADWMRNRPG
jgi:hemoglobin